MSPSAQKQSVLPAAGIGAALALVLAPVAVAALTGRWAISGAAFGFLSGFLLVKGDLCASAAFSEIVLMRDGRKLGGLWTAGVAAMAAFAVLDATGLVTLNPRPLFWASALVGGAIFGVGMVLAGGCVTGTLYKAGIGHANSLLALLVIPIGLWAVEFGPLATFDASLRARVVGDTPVTLGTITGLPFPLLAAAIAGATIAFGVRAARRRKPPPGAIRVAPSRPLLARPWRPWQAGLLLGLSAGPAWLAARAAGRDFALGVTDGVVETIVAVGGDDRRASVWPILFVAFLVVGAHAAARAGGFARLHKKEGGRLVAALIGGLLVGVGAGLGKGCILGNGVTGLALMSVGMIFFALVAMLANQVTTRVWVMGR